MRERDSCNSRHFSRLMKSCFPNPTDGGPSPPSFIPPNPISATTTTTVTTTTTSKYSMISSLPDDLLIEILSRVPLSTLPSLSSVCRRWCLLLDNPSFLFLRRHQHLLLHPTLFAFSLSPSSPNPNSAPFSTLRLLLDDSWNNDDTAFPINAHARLTAIGRRVYIIGRSTSALFDPWTGSIRTRSAMLFPRKRFAVAAVSGRIYVAGGSSRASDVEEYDPDSDEWRVVSTAPRRRYGCVGVGLDGVFYVIGGLKIGASDSHAVMGAETRVYASSMDLYDVAARGWLRSRAIPGGGCVVAACGAHGHVYLLTSHAVELSFWRFNAKRKSGAFGEWCRIRSPPLPAQVRVDGTVRFSCVGAQDKVVLIQVMGCIDDLLRRSGRNSRGYKQGLVLIFDCVTEEWSRGPDLPQFLQRAACVCVEC